MRRLYGILLLAIGCICAEEDPAFKLVNKQVSLGNYKPNDIGTFMDVKMSKRIIPDLKRLLEAAKKDGLILKPVSGYRSYDYQIGTFNRWVEREMKLNPKLTRMQAEEKANTYSAQAGHSEHQLGTTIDVLSAENGYKFSSDPKLKYIEWLEKNASRFNFKISHGKDSTQFVYEPWHLRWYPPKK
jgi:zinc D-Ala-D-Ala carboxypeptidase